MDLNSGFEIIFYEHNINNVCMDKYLCNSLISLKINTYGVFTVLV